MEKKRTLNNSLNSKKNVRKVMKINTDKIEKILKKS